ncbi:hypothetical protein PR202_gb03729 [Eleusine coracana subsp. coracana]|uniref:C2 NT-type domain-containing protein n=1 Tax=Eleusine coracana subsp. coracana TaxID=191504 RepID=A0AAV5E2M1_ELECO|nr:hypothetical protein QOZ80_1BG0096740 [Eleusine coracana subsp. coracana]GJN16710.1 hypothetical protein PR202_gb03729 [Eleusine coracana subsp. coracana]
MASARFRYTCFGTNNNSIIGHNTMRNLRQGEGGGGAEEDEEEVVPCFLDVYVHEACNMCIYGKQEDVYAKLSLTSAPDDDASALSTTRVFDERLPPLRVRRDRLAVDVLKCEVWMRRTQLLGVGDQLLGFALVPLAAVVAADGARLAAREFELSSTDLFHSPAGTIRLSLALHAGLPGDEACPPPPPERASSSITSEVVILDPPVDLNAVKENHDMAVQYLPLLQLGNNNPPESKVEMSTSSTRSNNNNEGEKEKPAAASSSDDGGSKNAASTTTTAISDDRLMMMIASSSANNREVIEKPPLPDESTAAPMSCRSPETPTSSNGKDDVFTSPMGGIEIDMVDAEQSEMQRQIMEMYVRSMQQFSESLAKMKMPIELADGDGVVVQKENKTDNDVKNDGARVFYGSRAFF